MLLEGKNLNLVYYMGTDEEIYALRNVNIELNAGEMIGVMGPSGSGKSSLLYVLAGLKKPMSGVVYYNDMDIEGFSPQEHASLRKNTFGFIFQRHFLIDYLSVLDNVMVAGNTRGKELRDKAAGLLDKLKIGHLAGKMPFQLSCGQRQRVSVARALINSPAVIFADEPTAALDHKNALEVMGILEECKGGSTIMVVTHDQTILKNADRIINMWDGMIRY